MTTRRNFLAQIGVSAAAFGAPAILTADERRRDLKIVRRDDTIQRLGGIGDNWHMSWAADDSQVVSVCDGYGWSKNREQFFNSRLWRIIGGPHDARFEPIAAHPGPISQIGESDQKQRYYNFGTLAIGKHIYQFFSTPNHLFSQPDARFVGVKLIYSPDNGLSWYNQDGTTPVVWEHWSARSHDNMLFFEEPNAAFSLTSVLQMGRGYTQNRDGYVYIYAPNGSTEGTMNELVLSRVETTRLLDRHSYEFFAGHRPGGRASWSPQIEDRRPLLKFVDGWVNKPTGRTDHPFAWQPSVTYNAALKLYLMASWATRPSQEGRWFSGPSYLGFWVARTPWGPWTQVHEESSWLPGGDEGARTFAPQIAPKWLSDDGKSFWLVWSDYQGAFTFPGDDLAKLMHDPKMAARKQAELIEQHIPHFAFNTQRVDILST